MARAPQVQEIEVFPEADRLDPFPHPRMTRKVFGHSSARAAFDGALRSGQCHHAWLMTGPEGVGKATLAYEVARFAMAEPPERAPDGVLALNGETRTARQIVALSHPGLLLIRRPYDPKDKRFRAVITVDEVRKLKSFLGHTGSAGSWRVVIVDPIDEMNVSAANALLKSLEEPPPRTLFLLICAEPGRLLPTIRSRCRQIQLGPLSHEDVRAAAEEAMTAAAPPVDAPKAGDWDTVLSAAGGSVRRLLMLAGGQGLEAVTGVRRILELLPKTDWTAAHRLADAVAPAAQTATFELFYAVLLDEMAQAARAGAGLPAPKHLAALGEDLAARGRLATWAELWESIAAEKAAAVALNLDRKTLVLDTIDRLAQATRA